MLFLPLLHLVLGLAPNFAAPSPPMPAADDSGLEQLVQEVTAFRRSFLKGPDGAHGNANGLVADLKNAYKANEADGKTVVTALLDLGAAALERHATRGLDSAYNSGETTLLNLTERALRPHLQDLDERQYLTREILLIASRHSPGRQAAAARLFRHHQHEDALLALLHCSQSKSDLVRHTSLKSLVGWSHPSVDRLMAKRLGRAQRKNDGRGAAFAEDHFKQTRVQPNTRSADLLEAFIGRALASKSWREVSLGISVTRGLPPTVAAPILIKGLDIWNRRGEEVGGTLRLRHELAGALKRLSGRNLGLRADRWGIWWSAVQAGSIQLTEAGVDQANQQFTSTGFFGINPKSDRVTFVIDMSGSMDSPFASRSSDTAHTGRTRYEEATGQLASFLEGLGKNGRFSVVLFSDRAAVWRTKLQSTSRTNVNSVRKWLKTKSPNGGTFLRDGIHKAFQMDRRGGLDLDGLETDTIVVLCDGATTEGSGWVVPFLKRQNQEARITFHCVQIGPGGDGTLELLARETGGDFRRIAH